MTRRHWLDWSKPCLPAAAEWLVEECDRTGAICDLRSVVCVTPGRRAGRVLAELVIGAAEGRGLTLLPPRFITPSHLPELLQAPGQAIASRAERVLAWLRVLREAGEEALAPLLARGLDDDVVAWHDLALMLCDLHEELDGERIEHEVVIRALEVRDHPEEITRWEALARLHERYVAALGAAGRVDPGRATQRTIEQCTAEAGLEQVVFIGVVDMNARQRRLASAFAEADRAVALVHAPGARADWFDDLGCVIPARWCNARIDLPDESIVSAGRPEDVAQAAVREIAAFDGRYPANEITIGLADPALDGRVRRAASWAGLDVHAAPGRALAASAPYRLLEAAAAWLDDPRFGSFSAMLRHPDVERTVRHRCNDSGVGDWLTVLDRYFKEHLHEHFRQPWLGDETIANRIETVTQAVRELLGPLGEPGERPLAAWARPVIRLLSEVYGWIETGTAAAGQTAEACVRLAEVVAEFERFTAALQPSTGAAAAIRVFLAHAATEQLPDPLRHEQVELLGWLELHLDPAPALLVVGMNDEAVPDAVLGDAFLPNTLRSSLGMSDNDRRHARDAYLLEAIVASRETVRLIAGRLDAVGESIAPSRLLLACDDDALVRRSLHFFVDDEPPAAPTAMGLGAPAAHSHFTVPPLPDDLPALESMRVTDFKRYMDCAYRFALERLVGLKDCDDAQPELDPLRFGILAHDILERFGRDPDIRDSDDADAIELFLLDTMRAEAHRHCGPKPPPAVRLQLARLAERLRGFARCQADLRRSGWRIVECEWMLDERNAVLEIPGAAPMPLRGKIDRIDRHESGAWRVIDYKTGERGDHPYKTHHGTKGPPKGDRVRWKDLQLPLYVYLARQSDLPIDGDLTAGYLVLSKQARRVRWLGAEWTDAQIESAIDRACEIVEAIRDGRFERSLDYASPFDSFARICQTTIFAGADDGEEGE